MKNQNGNNSGEALDQHIYPKVLDCANGGCTGASKVLVDTCYVVTLTANITIKFHTDCSWSSSSYIYFGLVVLK